MRVFISWSGPIAQQIAELLRSWLPSVIQQAEIFVSSKDIEKGTRGLDIIGQNLAETDFGLIVLTPDNVNAPWINFEAGALSKRLALSHVIPLLCAVTETDLARSPLTQFQHSKFEHDGLLEVIRVMNANCERPLTFEIIDRVFEKWWSDLSSAYDAIDKQPHDKPKMKEARKIDAEDLLDLVVGELQSIKRDIREIRRNDSVPDISEFTRKSPDLNDESYSVYDTRTAAKRARDRLYSLNMLNREKNRLDADHRSAGENPNKVAETDRD